METRFGLHNQRRRGAGLYLGAHDGWSWEPKSLEDFISPRERGTHQAERAVQECERAEVKVALPGQPLLPVCDQIESRCSCAYSML